MADETKATSFEGWAILELMGHRRLAGKLSEQVVGGASFIRVDVPGNSTEEERKEHGDNWIATQFYAPSAVYCITPTTEAMARKVAAMAQPAPVAQWELRPDRALVAAGDDDEMPY